jgi:hypothetical protein
MSRKSLGIATGLLVTIGMLFYWFAPGDGSNFGGQALRVGLVLGALWLAYPQLVALVKRVPAALWGYFAGKDKSGQRPDKEAAGGERDAPLKVKRPRRRRSA